MRGWLLAAVLVGMVHAAEAADLSDLPVLRGALSDGLTASRVNWSGFYGGAQASHGSADMDFSNSAQDLLAKLLNNVDVEQQFSISKWPLLSKSSTQSTGFGGFAGYNFQWEDAIVGVELNYTHGKFNNSSTGTQARTFFFPTNYYTGAAVAATSSMTITDYGSLRVRGAYALGSLLPYMFAGVALGQADINREASYGLFYQYTGSATPRLPDIGPTGARLSSISNSHFIYGYAGGLGIDMMLCANVFLRAEWEGLRFLAPVDTIVNTVRVGAGYKF